MVPALSAQGMIRPESGLRQAVAVGTVAGGQDTNPLWISKVSDAEFAAALRLSLSTHAMLRMGGETFRLDATLQELAQPFGGFDLQVTSRVAYRLLRVSDGATVFATEIRAPFTASFSSSLMAAERLRLANEGAVRENIRLFLQALVAEEARNPAAFSPAPRIS